MQTRGNALHSKAQVHRYSLCQTWLNLKTHTVSETEKRTSRLTTVSQTITVTSCPGGGGGYLPPAANASLLRSPRRRCRRRGRWTSMATTPAATSMVMQRTPDVKPTPRTPLPLTYPRTSGPGGDGRRVFILPWAAIPHARMRLEPDQSEGFGPGIRGFRRLWPGHGLAVPGPTP